MKLIMSWLEPLMERYPIPSGIIALLMGVGLLTAAVTEGARWEEFDGGTRVTGQVLSADEDPKREPRFAADVTWTPEGSLPWEGKKERAVIEVLQRQLPNERASDPERRLRKGSEIALVLSKRDSKRAMSVEKYENDSVVRIAGARVLTIPLAMGALFVVGAIGTIIQATKRRARPVARRPMPGRPAQGRSLPARPPRR